jgi:hypothetical protein
LCEIALAHGVERASKIKAKVEREKIQSEVKYPSVGRVPAYFNLCSSSSSGSGREEEENIQLQRTAYGSIS